MLLAGFLCSVLLILLLFSGYTFHYFHHYIEIPFRQFRDRIDEYTALRKNTKRHGFSELNGALEAFDSLERQLNALKMCIRDSPGSTPSFAGHMEQVKAIFSELIRGEKALELNTSRLLRQDVPRLPDPELFALYHEMGGRLVTLGADAHCTCLLYTSRCV